MISLISTHQVRALTHIWTAHTGLMRLYTRSSDVT